jgi:hypothetical protein
MRDNVHPVDAINYYLSQSGLRLSDKKEAELRRICDERLWLEVSTMRDGQGRTPIRVRKGDD